MIVITEELLNSLKTRNNGYKKVVFEILGHKADKPWKWCPPRGWKNYFISKKLTKEQVEALRAEVIKNGDITNFELAIKKQVI